MLRAFVVTALTAVEFAAAVQPNPTALPDVEMVLTKATGKAHDFAEQASAMQRRVAQQQDKSRSALAAQKAIYENKLAQQAAQSDAISANNTAINNAKNALQKSNTDLEGEVKALQDDNAKMRQSLQSIDSKVAAAKLFLEDSLKVTDDSGAAELQVLAPTTPKPTLDHFLAVAGGATGGNALALLQLSSPLGHEGPEELVSVLSKSLADIATAEVEGAAELKAHFMAFFEDGQKHQLELNATQAKLLELQSELKAHQGKLLEAKAHLEATGKQLRERLHGLRVFARKIDSAAVTPLGTPAVEAKPPQNSAALVMVAAKVKDVPVPVAAVPASTKQAPAPVATASAAPVPAAKKQEKPKAMLAEVQHQEHRVVSASRTAANVSVPRPEKRSSSPKKASADEKASSVKKASADRTESQHHKNHPKPPALIQSSSPKAREESSFMGTFLSTLR